jgi:exopolysaccharide biosynthesis polyprenyl glycosylphosphotransferase
MRRKDTFDVLASVAAVLFDAMAVVGGFMLATWLRFDSGWMSVDKGRPEDLYAMYLMGGLVATLVCLFVFKAQGLYVRPQTGAFVNKIPRLVKATGIGVLLATVLAFAAKNEADFSRLVIGIGFFSISFLVVLERYIIFRIEWNLARHSRTRSNVVVLGTDSVAAHVKRTLEREPMLRSRVTGFLRTDLYEPDESVPAGEIKGTVEELGRFLAENEVDQVILTNSELGHHRIVALILLCERNLVTFNMVPDLFRIMTTSMDVQSLDDIPLLGISKWPLDFFWNRILKRTEDIAGSLVGLILSSPVIAVAACLIKATSPGPVFYRQERCGEKGEVFNFYKLRTMNVDAEAETGPVFTAESDPRTTKVGSFLRRHNLDELPQLWNVLRGDMSLVGPRPERPHFVAKFKEDIGRYMWRHVSKPGLTGWAQVHGLRGNTSIEERIKYDLYYLENWSLALDFKILLRTVTARENAY